MKYRDYLELDTQAGLLRVKDNQNHWRTYHKGGVHKEPPPGSVSLPSIQVMPDESGVQAVTENYVRSAPEIIVVAILPDKTASEYIREG